MPDKTPPKAPSGLKAAGRRFWREVLSEYTLRPDERRVLESACRLLDRIDQLEAELASDEVMVRGSRGQPVLNPIVSEIRHSRDLFARLASRLALPDEPGVTKAQMRSVSARDLARQRWGGVR